VAALRPDPGQTPASGYCSAGRLGIGEGTVKIHPHHAYERLGVDSRVELANRLRETGIA
jgi:DNA-binding CsgD family transcriptional regulator